jgi:energy-coupling factor transporter transmembrane protein EcfT
MAMENHIERIISEETFWDENGNEFKKVTKEISIPRKTYLKGTILGKYRGDKLLNLEDENEVLFDFEIYEAEVICKSKEDFRKNEPYIIEGNEFPKHKLLPDTLKVTLAIDQKSFGINIIEPKIYDFKTVRRLHQIEGDEVFGTFNAFISGYIFDYEKKNVVVNIPVIYTQPISEPPEEPKCESNGNRTGNERKDGKIIQKEYHCKHHNDTVWVNHKLPPGPPIPTGGGCLSGIFSVIGAIIGLVFLLLMLPQLLYLLSFFILILVINLFEKYFKWIFRVFAFLLLLGFISAVFHSLSNRNHHYIPKPVIVDNAREKNTIEPRKDTIVQNVKDTIITKYRIWKDYNGNEYEGKYQLSLNAYKDSKNFKQNLNASQNNINSYDEIIYNLKNRDKNKLNGLYQLFDSINLNKKLSKIKFAEMIVSFVQDIPYAIVLDNDCDARLYNDPFTKSYLLNHKGECDSYQKFGINTPVEFLMNLKGDCDTRTLLLYSIFTHYNYDVALLSSEFYGHSILGINLPINGLSYNYSNQNYVLWETTAPNCKPGIIPNEISNLNNWRISLKSK